LIKLAEEFADFIEKLNKEPIEIQLEKLKDVINKLVDITEKFINNYTIELGIIHNKIITLDTKILKSTLPKIEVIACSPPPPPPNSRPIGDENVRTDVLAEIKGLFKKNGDRGK
jgi:hypothetical protein